MIGTLTRALSRRECGRGELCPQPQRISLVATLVVLLAALSQVAWLGQSSDPVAKGNRLYDSGKYKDAAQEFGQALVDQPDAPVVRYDMAAAQYKAGDYSDAAGTLEKLQAGEGDKLAARAAYNLGNTYYRVGQKAADSDPQTAITSYGQALAAYKRAMGLDPSDKDVKFNHEFVSAKLEELKKKLEEEKKKKEEEQKKKQEEQQQSQNQQQQDQQQQQQDQNQQQNQSQPQDQQQQQNAEQDQGQKQQSPQDQQQQQDQAQQDQQQQEQQQAPEDQQQQQSAAPQAEQPQEGQPGGEGQVAAAEGEQSAEDMNRKQAQGVIDTARDEEVRPEELRRARGPAAVAEPLDDW